MSYAHRAPSEPMAPKLQHNWDWRAAANFIAGGSGGGLLAFAAAASFTAVDVRPIILAGLVLIAAGLTCVWFEIGRPWRAPNVLRHLGSSWMSREAALAPLLFAAGGLALLTGEGAFALLGGVLGAVFLYCQARMLTADKAIPAWRHARCLPLVVATGFAEGAGILALFAPLLRATTLAVVAIALLAVLFVRAVLWKRYVKGLRSDGAPLGCLTALGAIDARFVMLGHVLPAALAAAAALAAFAGAPPGLAIPAGVLAPAGLFCVAGGWALKYALIRRAAFTQGFALERLPVRGRGAAGAAAKPGWSKAA